ncbi:MAG TPA: hypothetical protein VN867_05260, partial [Candidatus Binataceae bacterium]|nr:hypothetical protein [Candidatus Binataceae bacterium]
MRSRSLHSRRSAFTAALLFFAIAAMLAAHLDADSQPHHLNARADSQRRHAKYLANRRGLGFGVPRNAYGSAVAAMRAMERRAKSQARSENVIGAASSPQWNPIGPQPVANEIATFGGTPVGAALASATGRITSIAIDPTTQGRLFIGTAAGGVWMSVDGGATFTPIFDAQPTLAIGALALDPATNPPTIYAGTGEANNSGDSHYGLGVFVSSDLGNSWTQQTNGGAFLDVSFARIAIDTSQSPPSLFGAASIGSSSDRAGDSLLEGNMFDNGLWRSTDGANTWSHIPLPTQAGCPGYLGNCPADDVAIDPVSPTHMYASIYQYGVVTSTDGGDSWQMINFPGIANTAIGRASVAALNGRVYVALGSADGVEYRGFFNST